MVQILTDPTKNFLAWFVIGTLVFSIVSDGVTVIFWDVLEQQVYPNVPLTLPYGWFRAIVTTSLVALLLLLIYGTNLSRRVQRSLVWLPFVNETPIEANVVPLEQTYPGLIVAMSPREDSPAERVIRYHWNQGQAPHLKHCWLICTEKSLPFAKRMMQRLTDEGITEKLEVHFGSYALADDDEAGAPLNLLIPDALVDDPHYVHQLVDAVYENAEAKGLSESEVIADYTGATKGMTAGILLACLSPDRPLQYISQIQFPQMMAVKMAYRLREI